MKGNKGITLIALVITIIVLLILAAVSIAMLTGENSILKRASESSYSNTLGAAKDEVAILATGFVSDFYNEVYAKGNNTTVGNSLNTYVNKKLSEVQTSDLSTKGVTYTCTSAGAITIVYNADKTHQVTGTTTNGKIDWSEIK